MGQLSNGERPPYLLLLKIFVNFSFEFASVLHKHFNLHIINHAALLTGKIQSLNHKPKRIETTNKSYENAHSVPESFPAIEPVELGELPSKEEFFEEGPAENIWVLFLELNLMLVFQLVDLDKFCSLGIIQVPHGQVVLQGRVGRDATLYQRDMLHPEHPGLSVHDTTSEETNTSHIEQEEDEWFNREVTDTVVSPRAVVVHFVDTSVAFAAVMDAEHLETTALLT